MSLLFLGLFLVSAVVVALKMWRKFRNRRAIVPIDAIKGEGGDGAKAAEPDKITEKWSAVTATPQKESPREAPPNATDLPQLLPTESPFKPDSDSIASPLRPPRQLPPLSS